MASYTLTWCCTLLVIVVNTVFVNGYYVQPKVKVALLSRGFTVSIPDDDGIRFFSFHGKLNEEMLGREQGKIFGDVLESENGRWTFIDDKTELKDGDVLHFWTYIIYFDGVKNLPISNDDQVFIVANRTSFFPQEHNTPGSANRTQCITSKTRVLGRSVCSGDLIFEEQFNAEPASSVWTIETRFPSEPDAEFVVYMNETLQIVDGTLQIKPSSLEDTYGANSLNSQLDLGTSCKGFQGNGECTKRPINYEIIPPIISSRINTRNKFSFKYGSIKIRAKIPAGNWIYPQLQLEPQGNEYGDADIVSGLIRVAYTIGNPDYLTQLSGGLVVGSSEEARSQLLRNYTQQNDWSDDFHIFGLDWKPEGITLSVDGHIYGEVNALPGGFASLESTIKQPFAPRWKIGTPLAPFDKEFYLVLGVGVGGKNFPDNIKAKPWKNSNKKAVLDFWNAKNEWYPSWKNRNTALKVDYVKITAI